MSARALDGARVVIDTNALLDWLVFREPAAVALGQAVDHGSWVWCATPSMLDEWLAVLKVPLGPRWEASRELALTIDPSPWVAICPPPPVARPALVCRDPADQMFIDLALACRPSWLVTRDRALLVLRRRAALHGVAIGTPQQWKQRHVETAAPAAAHQQR